MVNDPPKLVTLPPASLQDEAEPTACEIVPAPPVSLSPRRADRVESWIARGHHRIRKRSQRIIEYALAGADIDDDAPKPPDWNDRKYRVAQDARKSLKERPIYIQIALENHKAYVASDAQKEASPQLNASVINVYVDRRTYETKEVKS